MCVEELSKRKKETFVTGRTIGSRNKRLKVAAKVPHWVKKGLNGNGSQFPIRNKRVRLEDGLRIPTKKVDKRVKVDKMIDTCQ